MLRTPLCSLFGIQHPVIQAPLAPISCADLAAAVSNAGGLGTYGCMLRPPSSVREELARLKDRTDRPFAINHTFPAFHEKVFRISLEARPRVISFALGMRPELIQRAHDAGALFMQQVHTVRQAREAAQAGVDVVIAQGTEAGGVVGTVSSMVLVPQVVRAVHPLPVVAAGGIANGQGLVAALALGAQGVNVGTRFLASAESAANESWKQRIVEAESEDTTRASFVRTLLPPVGPGGFDVAPRALQTDFTQRWGTDAPKLREDVPRLRDELETAARAHKAHELLPIAGQGAGMVREILPAAEILRRMIADAEETLEHLRETRAAM